MERVHDQPGHGHRHQYRNLPDPWRRHHDRLVPVRAGAGRRPHLLRHARGGRRDRARRLRRRRAHDRRDRQAPPGRHLRLRRARLRRGAARRRSHRRARAPQRRTSRHRGDRGPARGDAGAERLLQPARRARGATGQGGDRHRHRALARRGAARRGRHRARRHRRRLRRLYRRDKRDRGRPATGAAARSLRAGRQRRRPRRAPDSRLARDARTGARARPTLPLYRAEPARRLPEELPQQYRLQESSPKRRAT